MSGPVTDERGEIVACGTDDPTTESIEVADATRATVGTGEVRRLLPRRQRRTVGAWCFLDHFGPSDDGLMAIGPHPHIGLQTVTWLLDGELLHRDTVGSEQVIRANQLNLMTSGHGIAHSEERSPGAGLGGHGVQLWVALPDETRDDAPAFEHHAELPGIELIGADGQVLVGTVGDVRSPARADTDHLGFQLDLYGRCEVPLGRTHEHAIAPLDDQTITIDGRPLAPDQVAYLAPGRDSVTIAPADPSGGGTTRVLVLGGAPWDVRISMWWNFVGRDKDEITRAYEDWQRDDERFGTVASGMARIAAPRPPWLP